jgi:predicted O-linked N-acetylglucosamine transferase (SPINDLY family)
VADDVARDRIEADGIDVLVDLSGHTAGGRLGIFAHRAAPVQAHYIGYFASTGLTEMDYWIGDAQVTPVTTDGNFSEQVWRLPRAWMSYGGKAETPPITPAPDGVTRLGSFNSLRKVTPATLRLWARVLQALPEAHLLLKTRELGEAENREHVRQFMHAAGIALERIELLDGSTTPDWRSHMACYNAVDIALDPVGGVGGGTTTCDALWMAVPVVTLAGDRMASRMTTSMLTAIGHPEWIAGDEDQYVAKVLELARDPGARLALRAAGRQRIAQSPLFDVLDLTSKLEDAYIEMFDRWKTDTR